MVSVEKIGPEYLQARYDQRLALLAHRNERDTEANWAIKAGVVSLALAGLIQKQRV